MSGLSNFKRQQTNEHKRELIAAVFRGDTQSAALLSLQFEPHVRQRTIDSAWQTGLRLLFTDMYEARERMRSFDRSIKQVGPGFLADKFRESQQHSIAKDESLSRRLAKVIRSGKNLFFSEKMLEDARAGAIVELETEDIKQDKRLDEIIAKEEAKYLRGG